MQIEIQKDTSRKIEETAKLLGLKREDLVDRAVMVYIDGISKYLELKKELNEWDVLSDEALVNFEKSL
ncbi:hypothetical protein HYT54_01710 [Candidatus Woesearchaeota archaeon]|nr:hypothetical protein [Candidatus Woesearchaeota archaeon]